MAAAQATSGPTSSVSDQRKLMEILLETERVADRILSNRQELVQLDQRRQDTREALRLIEQHFPTESPRGPGRLWITIGSMLVKQDRQEAIELLRKDQRTTEAEIERLRAEQKVLVSRQRDLEHDRPLRGFDLKPLSRAEIAGIRSNLPGF